MDNRIIAEKYEIIDTLFSNELQATYTAKETDADDSRLFIINEFKNTDIIYSMKDSFSKEKCSYIRNIVETFYEDFCFYVVCNICSGPTMENYLSNNNLRLTEKMYLTESLLTQLIDIEKLGPLIVLLLCDADNIAVTNKRNVCFNCNLKFTEEMMSASRSDVCKRAGEIICTIFSNSPVFDQNYAKDSLPPALFPIVQNCLEGKYESIEKVYNDFKSLLLYSVFMGSGSVDSQMRKNYHKAKIKRKLTPLRRLAVIAVILLFAGGVWAIARNSDISTLNSNEPAPQNTKPSAQFTADKKQVYEGETVIFTSESSDPDTNDSIKSYFWKISNNENPVFDSPNQNITYTFTEAGKYEVNLVVTDTQDESSEPFKFYINVLSKLVFPSAETVPGTEDNK